MRVPRKIVISEANDWAFFDYTVYKCPLTLLKIKQCLYDIGSKKCLLFAVTDKGPLTDLPLLLNTKQEWYLCAARSFVALEQPDALEEVFRVAAERFRDNFGVSITMNIGFGEVSASRRQCQNYDAELFVEIPIEMQQKLPKNFYLICLLRSSYAAAVSAMV